MKQEYAYWMALSHLPKLKIARKNEIVIRLFEEGLSIVDFFHFGKNKWQSFFSLNKDEIDLFTEAKKELPNYAFLVEDLLEQGYQIIPITSSDYSPWMKKNLKRTNSPPLIYIKGNKQILQESSIAIVGSRKANRPSLQFTDHVAKEASKQNKVVVSGFAQGVDKRALDSTLKYKGQSIIVLPQGIATFQSGYKKYYQPIISGDVLVLSTYFPKAPWSAPHALGRNPIIYGLANEIFVAESGQTGGTWEGALNGLKRGRRLFVRVPGEKEKNANKLLIGKGAIPVDENGKRLKGYEGTSIQMSILDQFELDDKGTQNIDEHPF